MMMDSSIVLFSEDTPFVKLDSVISPHSYVVEERRRGHNGENNLSVSEEFRTPSKNPPNVICDKENTHVCADDGQIVANNTSKSNENRCLDLEREKEVYENGSERLDISSTTTSRKNKIVLILCATAMFISSCACSVIAPFYPQEAQKKGMDLTTIGFVFGVYQLVIFLASPVIGTYITKIGVKFVFISGLFFGGSCTIFFGVLDKGPSGASFAAMCILCRSLEAFGFACFTIATMTIASNAFPDKIGRVAAVIETSACLGYMVGPVVGGCLYDLGGFSLPFYCMGGCTLLNGIVLWVVLPEPKNVSKSKFDKNDKREKSVFSLFLTPMVFLPWLSICIGTTGMAMLDSLYATHMEQFDLTASALGGLFVIGSIAFVLSAPIWGNLSGVQSVQIPLMILGHLSFGLSFWINGPSPFLPFLSFNLWTHCLSYVLRGTSIGILTIVGMQCMVTGAYESEYEKNEETYAMVSSLYNSGYSCGGFCGPLVGGPCVGRFGFPITYTAFGILHFCLMFVLVGYFSFRYLSGKKSKVDAEKSVLCNNDD